MSRYFVCLIPQKELKQKIQVIKYYFKSRYKASHALNAPPHITLLSPFRLEDENEDQLKSLLNNFVQNFDPFEVNLNNFSTFPPRVVFIDVEKSPKLKELQEKLEELARSNSELFNYNYNERPYHPHLTLAFKDLTKKNFHKAWKEFQDRTFDASFKADALYLLKHNGEKWDVINSYNIGQG